MSVRSTFFPPERRAQRSQRVHVGQRGTSRRFRAKVIEPHGMARQLFWVLGRVGRLLPGFGLSMP